MLCGLLVDCQFDFCLGDIVCDGEGSWHFGVFGGDWAWLVLSLGVL